VTTNGDELFGKSGIARCAGQKRVSCTPTTLSGEVILPTGIWWKTGPACVPVAIRLRATLPTETGLSFISGSNAIVLASGNG